ncbi:MAG TPA: hypothetical protein VIH57_13645 [Bacteroidales bacterium]
MSYREVSIKLVILLVFTVYVKPVLCQYDDKPFHVIRARLINSRTGGPVVFASIINKNLRYGVLSDSLGVFSLSARIGDTLYIKSISFYPAKIAVADSLIWQLRIPEIPLEEQAYEMGGIDIYGWGSYQEFKYKFLHTETPEDKTKLVTENLRKAIGKLPVHPLQEQAAIPLGSPVTALYMLFSKEGKSLRRLQAAKERDKVFLFTYQKFNRDIVAEITGLSGNLLDKFMLYCKPDDQFLIQANDYDIHLRVLEDYEKFKKEILDKEKNKASQ